MWTRIAKCLLGCWECWPIAGCCRARGSRLMRRRWSRTRPCARLCDTGESYEEFARTGEGLGHRDADARGLGATGPQAQEAHVEPGVEESGGRGCADCEDERRAHALGPQGRA